MVFSGKVIRWLNDRRSVVGRWKGHEAAVQESVEERNKQAVANCDDVVVAREMHTGGIFDDPLRQMALFQRVRYRLLRNTIRTSLLRVASILLSSLLIWGSIFVLSELGFRELRLRFHVPLNGSIIGLTLDALFVALSALLIFSTGIILYSSLFASEETKFLLSSPLRADQIFAYKLQGAIGFSSWAFLLLGSPILIAYGIEVDGGAPWYFYAALPLFFFGFVLLPGSLGALACLLLVNYIPKHKKQIVILAMVVVLGGLGLLVYRWAPKSQAILGSKDWIFDLLGDVALVQGPFIPAHWIGQGLQSSALGEVVNMFYFLAMVWGHGLFFYVITAWLAGKLLRRGFNRTATGGTLRRRYGGLWLDHTVSRILFFMNPRLRLLIVKDFRTFRRDPAQWAQILIFLCLAVLYFSNIRKFYEQGIGKAFQNGISLLNMMATGFLMCAYTGRFIFPLLSLEGRKFWILGLLPLERDSLLWGKFVFSATGCLVVGEFLITFSDLMLGMPWHIIMVHCLIMLILALGLSGLSVGLGACMPNFRESDPSKIAVGFGGTLNLVAGLLFLVAVIALMAGPWHLVLAADREHALAMSVTQWWLWAAVFGGLAIGVCGIYIPLRAGMRTLRQMEF
jgi:ABC-2 type transport system permease protein